MSVRVAVSVAIGLLTFVALYGQSGHAQTGLALTVTAEAVGITISGDGTYDFGGPWGPGLRLRAHPQSTQENVVGMPPTITNSGNLPITWIDLAYQGVSGQEAVCDGGQGHWEAHHSAVAQDRFMVKAWASNELNIGPFNSNAKSVVPGEGTNNILHSSASPLAPDGEIPLLLELWTPSVMVAGGDGCTISMVITAAAA